MTERCYLTVAELSEYIRRSQPAIRMLVLRRRIPFYKPAGRLIFSREEIDAWVREEGVSLEVWKEERGNRSE